MPSIADYYPAITDDNGNTWYRPAEGDGWTSDPTQAHPSYGVGG